MKKYLFVLLLMPLWLSAQLNPSYNHFLHFSVKDGLSESSVMAFEEDQLGRMWIGTRNGLNLYDGEEVRIFRSSPENTEKGLVSSDVISLEEDNEGYIWIGTFNGLSRFDPKTESFETFFNSTTDGERAHRSVRVIKQLNDGSIWIGTSLGLLIYNKQNGFLSHTTIAGIENLTITDIFEDSKKRIWLGTEKGLVKVIPDGAHFIFQKMENQKEEHDFQILSVNQMNTDVLLIGTKKSGLYTYNLTNTYFTPYKPELIASKDIRKIEYDSDKNLWIGTYDGAFIIDNHTKEITAVRNQMGNPHSLSKNSIKEIFVDKKGSVWLGTYYGGVNIWNKNNINFNAVYRVDGDKAQSLGVVSSIVEDHKGTAYYGTEGNGIFVFNHKGKYIKSVSQQLSKTTQNDNIKALWIDEHKLWIGTLKKGIFCYDLNIGKFVTDKTHAAINEKLQYSPIYAITGGGDYIYFGTFGQGLIVLDKRGNRIQQIKSQDTKYLTNDRIRCLFSDHNLNLWIGTDKGLNRLAYTEAFAETPQLDQFLFDTHTEFGENIISLYETYDNTLLVGTKESGVLIAQNKNFEPLDIHPGSSDVISAYSIVEDAHNELWIASNLGLIEYDMTNHKSTIYSHADGILNNEFINNAFLKKSNGQIVIGGVAGATQFMPDKLQQLNKRQRVILNTLHINGDEESVNMSFRRDFVFDYDQSSFTIQFSLPDYTSLSSKRYLYRLKGLNDTWRLTDDNEAAYTIQNPGSYVFEVKSADIDNNAAPATLYLKVKPAPWNTWWAYAIYSILIALILYQIYKSLRARLILQHQLQLERLDKERQVEINRSKLEFFTNISHDFRTPLALILAPLEQLLTNYKGSKSSFDKLKVIERNAAQLLQLINQLLDFRKFEGGNAELNVTKYNIITLLEDVFYSFKDYAKLKKYNFSLNTSVDSIAVYYDRSQLEKVMYNLVSNAFKFTAEGGTISLNVSENDTEVIITVTDNGKGIDAAFVTKIFDRYYEVASNRKYQKHFNQGSGIGLHIAQKVVELHGGTIAVKSKENKGTTFTVKLRKGISHFRAEQLKVTGLSYETETFNSPIYGATADNKSKLDTKIKSLEEDKEFTVLFVEDNDEFRNYVAELLSETYKVETADNGEEGYKKAIQLQPDVIVTDVVMPVMEGTELSQKIKSDERLNHIPVIMLTSASSSVQRIEGLQSGADVYITKPFAPSELLLSIKNILNSVHKIKAKYPDGPTAVTVDTIEAEEEKLLKRAIKIVETHLDDPSFDVIQFSEALGLSRTALFTKIKDWTAQTPKEFINTMRMKRASYLLERGEVSVANVCYKVGFKDPKYFSKCFKKYYNTSPSLYAEKFIAT